MCHRRCRSCVLLTVTLAGLIARAAIAQSSQPPAEPTPPQGLTIEQAEEQVQKISASLDSRTAPPEAWGTLLMAEMLLLKLSAEEDGLDEEALQAAQSRLRQRHFAEWKSAQPNDPAPYLAEVEGTVPPAGRDDAVLDLLPRFPDDPRLLGRALQILSGRQETERASALLEGALTRHPERSALYPLALGFYRQAGDETRQRELVEGWIERQPGSADALRAWLAQPASARDPREAANRVDRFVSADAARADAKRVDACAWLLTADAGAHHDAAVRCLSAVAEEARDARLRERAAGLLANVANIGGGGDERELARRLAGLPPERRQEELRKAVAALEERLRRQSDRVEVWRALAAAYELAGRDERRAAHLEAWLGTKLPPPSREDLAWLERFRAAHASP